MDIRLAIILIFSGFTAYSQTVDFTANEVCHGKMMTLAGNSTFNDADITDWGWDLNNDGEFYDALGKQINHTFSQSDTFTVGLRIITNSGTRDSLYKNVVVHPLPDVNFHVDNLCEGQSATYIDQSTLEYGSITQYQWDFNNDGIIDDNSGPVADYTVGPSATYVTKLICVSDNGCSSFATKTTEVHPAPVASFAAEDGCVEDTLTFSNNSTIASGSIELNIWNFDDGGELSITTDKATHAFMQPGTYSVSLIALSNKSCRDTAIQLVIIDSLPSISFTYSGDTVITEGETLDISVEGDDTYNWSTGEGGKTIAVREAGSYMVTATNSGSCRSVGKTALVKVIAKDESLANEILTPNADGINDYLEIKGRSNCEISIYNMWGDQVYSNSSYQNDWDGTYDGKPLDTGSYYFIVRCDGEEETGNINILR